MSQVKTFWEKKCKEAFKQEKASDTLVRSPPKIEENVAPLSEREVDDFYDSSVSQGFWFWMNMDVDSLYMILLTGFLVSGFGLFMMNHWTEIVSFSFMTLAHWRQPDLYYHVREAQRALTNISTFLSAILTQKETFLNLLKVASLENKMNSVLNAFYSTIVWIQDSILWETLLKTWILFVTFMGRFQTLENSILSSFGFHVNDAEWIGNLLVVELLLSFGLLLFCSWTMAKVLNQFLKRKRNE